MLTISQQKTYQFIQKFVKKNGYSPTIAEIAAGIGIKSRGVVHRYVQALVTDGLIEISPKHHRNIQLIEDPDEKKVLVIGRLSNGHSLEKIPSHQVLDVCELVLAENRFALKVKDNTMIEEGILPGDLIICEKKEKVKEGDITVVLIDQKIGMLKRVQYNNDETISLLPVYSRRMPVVYHKDQVEFQGHYVGIVRLEK